MAPVKNTFSIWRHVWGKQSNQLVTFEVIKTPPCMYGVNSVNYLLSGLFSDTPLHVWGKPLPLECKPYNGTAWGFDYELIAF